MLLAFYFSSFANTIQYNVSQNSWRWRNNDGSEAKATWKASQNTAVNYSATGTVIRLRIEMINNSVQISGCGTPECDYQIRVAMDDSLQYSTTPADGSSWKNIGIDSRLPFVMAGSDKYISQNEPTTPQLTGDDHTFSPGKIMVSDSVLKNIYILSNSRSEFEWAIATTSNLRPNTTYYFRQIQRFTLFSSTQYPTAYPSIKTTAVLATKLSNFVVSNDDKKIKLEWSTASQQNGDYFNIERSVDGRTWTLINKINSNGNSTVTTNYTDYDYNPPLNNTIYYRLQQYNQDGSFTFSDIQSISISAANKTVVSVFPNPAKADINFKLENTTVKNIQAILTDIGGRIIYRQIFENVQPGLLNKLNLQHAPTPGIYILKLTGDGLLENIKIIVQ